MAEFFERVAKKEGQYIEEAPTMTRACARGPRPNVAVRVAKIAWKESV